MNAPLSPDAMSTQAENELICEKLLDWKQSSILGYWFPSPCHVGTIKTPSFDTWAEAGLILDEFNRRKLEVDIAQENGKCWVTMYTPKPWSTAMRESLPPAVREAAIEYIRAVKS